MTSSAIKGHGTELQRGDGATPTEAFTKIAELLSIGGPSLEGGVVDVTHLDSGTSHDKIGEALVDGGQVTIEGNYIYDDTQQDGLLTDLYAGTARNFKLVFSNAQEEPFTAIVQAYEKEGMEKGSQVRFSATLEVTGKPTTA